MNAYLTRSYLRIVAPFRANLEKIQRRYFLIAICLVITTFGILSSTILLNIINPFNSLSTNNNIQYGTEKIFFSKFNSNNNNKFYINEDFFNLEKNNYISYHEEISQDSTSNSEDNLLNKTSKIKEILFDFNEHYVDGLEIEGKTGDIIRISFINNDIDFFKNNDQFLPNGVGCNSLESIEFELIKDLSDGKSKKIYFENIYIYGKTNFKGITGSKLSLSLNTYNPPKNLNPSPWRIAEDINSICSISQINSDSISYKDIGIRNMRFYIQKDWYKLIESTYKDTKSPDSLNSHSQLIGLYNDILYIKAYEEKNSQKNFSPANPFIRNEGIIKRNYIPITYVTEKNINNKEMIVLETEKLNDSFLSIENNFTLALKIDESIQLRNNNFIKIFLILGILTIFLFMTFYYFKKKRSQKKDRLEYI